MGGSCCGLVVGGMGFGGGVDVVDGRLVYRSRSYGILTEGVVVKGVFLILDLYWGNWRCRGSCCCRVCQGSCY